MHAVEEHIKPAFLQIAIIHSDRVHNSHQPRKKKIYNHPPQKKLLLSAQRKIHPSILKTNEPRPERNSRSAQGIQRIKRLNPERARARFSPRYYTHMARNTVVSAAGHSGYLFSGLGSLKSRLIRAAGPFTAHYHRGAARLSACRRAGIAVGPPGRSRELPWPPRYRGFLIAPGLALSFLQESSRAFRRGEKRSDDEMLLGYFSSRL